MNRKKKHVYVRVLQCEAALVWSVRGGSVEIVHELLQRHADPNCKDDEGRTALMLAADKGYNDILGALMRTKPNLEAKTPARPPPSSSPLSLCPITVVLLFYVVVLLAGSLCCLHCYEVVRCW